MNIFLKKNQKLKILKFILILKIKQLMNMKILKKKHQNIGIKRKIKIMKKKLKK